MNKGKKSIYNAITAFAYTLISGLLGLIVTRLIIINYGSDFNGLNSTANQFIGMLLILEGGFTLATNVALFKPLANRQYKTINEILSATRIIFIKIGIIFLVIGIVASIVYSFFVKSNLSFDIIILTFIMSVISSAFNLLYATKYSILLQTDQHEYTLNLIKIVTMSLSQSLIILIIFMNGHMLMVRFITMIGSIVNSLFIAYMCKKQYKFLCFNEPPNFTAIKGTKDVFAQKFTGMIYGTIPIIFISASAGTAVASIYAVYNNVFMLIKSLIYAVVNAPRMGFGELIAKKHNKYVQQVFLQYELIVIISLLTLLSTATVIIMPFINLYTYGVSDIDYLNWPIALLMVLITFFEIIHIPSGNILNMAAKFKVSKNIQIIACVALIVFMILGNQLAGVYGILFSVLITSILLALMEIIYVHYYYFKKSIFLFLKLLLPNITLSGLIVYIELKLNFIVSSYIDFIFVGSIFLIINMSVFLFVNIVLNRKITLDIFDRFKNIKTYFNKK